MNRTTRNYSVLLTLLTLFLIPMASWAMCSDPPPEEVARVENGREVLYFEPLLERFDKIELTITGPAEFQFYRVTQGDVMKFIPSDETLIDGCYTYELRVTPKFDSQVYEILHQARKSGNMKIVNRLRREGILPKSALVQSGGFHIIEGEIIYDEEEEERRNPNKDYYQDDEFHQHEASAVVDKAFPYKDFVINDDLIVDGSACIGFDCVNGESFSFDTIRLKENNLRIKFDDTSVAASFPRTDWQLTANASANGGASKFSIDDISGGRTPFTVEANARSNSLYVDDGGRIGNRTSTPSTEIHTIDGDTPTLRLQQDGSSGFAPQTWDVAGNETNFFIRDVSNGSQLPFRIQPGAPTSAIFIATDGNVGLGTASPDASLDVSAASSTSVQLTNTSAEAWAFLSSDGGNFVVTAIGSGATEMQLATGGDLTIAGELTTAANTYPDYVFEDDYQLMSLADLASFIDVNGHLPNVPSAAETEGGKRIPMTELQIRTLEKVEELVLYTLGQQDTIDGQQQMIQTQQQVIDQLMQRLSALEDATPQP